jgi:ATP-dependent Clp protease protease subunit
MEDEQLQSKPASVWEAEKAKLEAEAAAALADARHKAAEAAVVEAELAKSEVARDKVLYERRMELAKDEFHHVFFFDMTVDSSSVDKCMEKLRAWHRNDPGCEIEVWFDSPGGQVRAGMRLFDYIRFLRREGHYVTTAATGYAASMAGILLQAGDKRIMARESYMLIHEIQAGAIGSMGELEDEMEFLKKIQARIIGIFAERSTLSAATIRAKWRRKNWWINSDEALKYGFVDEIR